MKKVDENKKHKLETKTQQQKYANKIAIKTDKVEAKKFKKTLLNLDSYVKYYNILCEGLLSNLKYIEDHRKRLKDNPSDNYAFFLMSEKEAIENYGNNKKYVLLIQEKLASMTKEALKLKKELSPEKTQEMEMKFLKTKKVEFYESVLSAFSNSLGEEYYNQGQEMHKVVDLTTEATLHTKPVFPNAFDYIENMFNFHENFNTLPNKDDKDKEFDC